MNNFSIGVIQILFTFSKKKKKIKVNTHKVNIPPKAVLKDLLFL